MFFSLLGKNNISNLICLKKKSNEETKTNTDGKHRRRTAARK
jgi:hypothetical protein